MCGTIYVYVGMEVNVFGAGFANRQDQRSKNDMQ